MSDFTAFNLIEATPETPELKAKRAKNREWLLKKLDWIKQQRTLLTELMGGKCCLCNSTEKLEFDHPHGRGGSWDCRKPARWVRIKLYWLDFRAGNLRLLCGKCNRSYRYKGASKDGSNAHYSPAGHFAVGDATVNSESAVDCAEGG